MTEPNDSSTAAPLGGEYARRGWFADWDSERAVGAHGWQPCLETGHGHVPCFEVWSKTKAECEEWIAENVIGVEWSPGDPEKITPSRTPIQRVRELVDAWDDPTWAGLDAAAPFVRAIRKAINHA